MPTAFSRKGTVSYAMITAGGLPKAKRRSGRAKRAAAAAVAMATLGASSAHAANTIIGVFSDPIYSGIVLHDPTVGQDTFIDNSTTAPASTIISNNGSSLQWGTNTGLPASEEYSQLVFTGASGLPSSFSTPMQIGSISFLNGTSALNSLIFGATLSFYLNSASSANLVGTDTVIINTTSNQYSGTGLTLTQLQTDSDYVNICGNASNICDKSIEAYEDSEGGTGLTVNLDGTLDGLVLTSVSPAPGQDPLTSGTVGSLPALSVPEPASMALLSGGLFGLAGMRQWRRKG